MLRSAEGFINVAHRLADMSGKTIMPYFRQALSVENKTELSGSFDPVTLADKEAEEVIRKELTTAWPEHGIYGEEFGQINPDADYCWIIDPIDGTRAFITGSPLWGTLIGLTHHNQPIVGLMDQPYLKERFWASEGFAYFRGPGGEYQLKVRSCSSLATATLATTAPDLFQPGYETEHFNHIKSKVRMTRYGGDCYSYCLLASGHLDLVVEAGLRAFDIAPLIPIIENAGGYISTWEGKPATLGGRIVAAGDAVVHAQALEILSK